MQKTTKVSDITYQDIADYIRIYEVDTDTQNTLETIIDVAKAFILSYTGVNSEDLDTHQDFVIATFVLAQDMWDNRALYVDKDNINFVVKSLLDMHSVNLL